MGELLKALDESVGANTAMDPKIDAALVESARTIAAQIDFAVANLSGQDATKALYLTPHLVNILREMRATPASRQAVAAKAEEAKGGVLASVSNIPRPA